MPVALTEETLASVLSQLSALENSLPDGPDLTSEERKRKRRVGESGAYEIAEMAALLRQTSTFLPGNFGPVSEFLDGAAEQERWQLLERAALRLVEVIGDARVAQGDPIRRKASQAFDAARQFGEGAFVADAVGRIEAHRKRDPDEPEA